FRLVALGDLVDAKVALGRHRDMVAELRARLREQPYRERLRGQLMVSLYPSSRQTDAPDAYRPARRALSSLPLIQLVRWLPHPPGRVETATPPVCASGSIAGR